VPCEVLTVYDSPDDTTVTHLESYARHEARLRPLHNTYGRGPAAALRFGIDHAESRVVVVTWPMAATTLTRSISWLGSWSARGRGRCVAVHARRPAGGRSWLKGRISAVADRSLHSWPGWDSRRDQLVQSLLPRLHPGRRYRVGHGFTLGIEMVAKAKRRGLPVAEIPTIWLDRAEGTSNFGCRSGLRSTFTGTWWRSGPAAVDPDRHLVGGDRD